MNNHQSLKAEIDTREENFSACFKLGKELLSRSHYASNEVKLLPQIIRSSQQRLSQAE
jgi:spectrin beta